MTNKSPEKAISLLYDGDGAPRITASGRGKTAEEIIALARDHEVPLHENTELVDALIQLPIGEEVPEALYVAVAEVLSFAYLLSGKRPPGYDSEPGSDSTQPRLEQDD
jgi:flagellar biosynthesis protein